MSLLYTLNPKPLNICLMVATGSKYDLRSIIVVIGSLSCWNAGCHSGLYFGNLVDRCAQILIVCVCVYTCIYIYTHAKTPVCMYMHACMDGCMHAYICNIYIYIYNYEKYK